MLVGDQHSECPTFHNPLVILPREDTVNRESESPSPFHAAVTRGVVAALPGEYPLNVTRKRERTRLACFFDTNGGFGRPAANLGRQYHLSRASYHKLSERVNFTHFSVRERQMGCGRHLP